MAVDDVAPSTTYCEYDTYGPPRGVPGLFLQWYSRFARVVSNNPIVDHLATEGEPCCDSLIMAPTHALNRPSERRTSHIGKGVVPVVISDLPHGYASRNGEGK